MDWNYVISFFLGVIGALVIVWLRWIDALPRFKSAIEIASLENEYSAVSSDITKKIRDNSAVDCCEVTHSNNLRDDIWRQRSSSFLVSAFMYLILGGATALIFIGLDVQNPLETANVMKLIAAGALWSSFYSFIEVKKADDFGLSKMNEVQETMVTQITEEHKKDLKDIYDNCQNLQEKYTALINDYQEKISKANQNVKDIGEKYNVLIDKYQKLYSLNSVTEDSA